MPFEDPKNAQKRVRDIRLWWERDPNGPIIPRTLSPLGMRTAEGFVWGHKLEHLFWIQRIPGVNAMTIWSRSMLKEFGEGYDENEWDEPLVEPRVLRPWPVLKLLDGAPSPCNPPIGAIDGGCECEHSEHVQYRLREAEPYELRASDGTGSCDGVSSNSKSIHEEDSKDAEMKDADVSMVDADAGCENDTSNTEAQPSTVAPPETVTESLPEAEASGMSADTQGTPGTPSESTEKEGSLQNKKGKGVSVRTGLFSCERLPKLEEFIPEEFFPDVLMVHDPDNATNQPKQEGSETCTEKPIKYVRWFPKFKRDDENGGAQEEVGPRVAHLHLAQSNRFGTGNHSYVYRAPLTLPAPLSAHSPTGQVTVAAKLAYPRCTAHNLLRNEARVYDSFPKYVQEEYCGYNIVPQCRFPVPATAIVPKFFGYYLPVDERGNVLDNHHDSCSEEKPCSVKWPSPILLMEECGKPVEPSKFTLDQRTECFSLILRLRHMDLYQGSFYVRNIMIQPGPLTLPPAERSYDRPSFRIIDFGRAASWEMYSTDPARLQRRIRTWQADRDRDRLREGFLAHVGEEVWRARGELLIDDFTF